MKRIRTGVVPTIITIFVFSALSLGAMSPTIYTTNSNSAHYKAAKSLLFQAKRQLQQAPSVPRKAGAVKKVDAALAEVQKCILQAN